jgi:HEAT repeat protein
MGGDMSNRNLYLGAAFLCSFVAVCASAQDVTFNSNFPPVTFADALRSKGVTDLSADSLRAALKSPQADIRSLAANQLAEDGRSDAVRDIETALSVEQDLHVQVGLAGALWVLHDPKGVAHLKAMCSDARLPMEALLQVVRTLQNTNSSSESCVETFLGAMSREKEPGNVGMAMSNLAWMHRTASPQERKLILTTIQGVLLDGRQATSVRIMAGHALAQMNAPESVELLRRALSQEENSAVRESIQRDLKGLEKEQQQ